ncbi:MAG: hypothetical protein NTX87_20460, partial [Planctomycetota bacterium]|nr:hypothetical protein [Planctomycetota bacterium]
MSEPPLTPPEGRQREMTGNSHNPVSVPEGSPPLPTPRRRRKWSIVLLLLGIVYLLAGSSEEYQDLVGRPLSNLIRVIGLAIIIGAGVSLAKPARPARHLSHGVNGGGRIEAEAARPDGTGGVRWRKRLYLAAILVLAAVFGGIGVLTDAGSRGEVRVWLSGVISFAVLVYLWCRADARERGFHLRGLLSACIILFAAVGVPVYLFKSRGVQGFRALGLAVLFYLATLAVDYASGYTVWYVWSWFTGCVQKQAEREDKAVSAIRKLGGKVTRAEEPFWRPVVEVDLTDAQITDAGLK